MIRVCFFLVAFVAIYVQCEKRGDCPPPTGIGICGITCRQDEQCQGQFKCCSTACGGTFCTKPIDHRDPLAKPGQCPERPVGPWVCTSRCAYDNDCYGKQKCCTNRCGALACTAPV